MSEGMTKVSHTPGPWEWGVATISAAGRPICNLCATPATCDEDAANAHLIEAAPDLLAACNEALEFTVDCEPGAAVSPLSNQLRDAIAKAEAPTA